MIYRGSTVYLIHSVHNPDQQYTGLTTKPISTRLAEHNEGTARSTRRHRPWNVLVAIWLPDPAKARAFERDLKTGSGRAFAKRHF